MNPSAILTASLILFGAARAAFAQGPLPGPPAPLPLERALAERVTLTLEREELAGVLTMLGEWRRVNIVAGPEVAGVVTANLYEIPFGDALRSLLGPAGFTYFVRGNVIYVTSEENKANLPLGVTDLAIRTFRINHLDPAGALESIAPFLSPAGKAVQSPGRDIIIRDAPDYLEDIAELLRQLDIPPLQVRITARIFSIALDDDLTIGVDFSPPSGTLDVTDILTNGFARNLTALPAGATGIFAGARIGEEDVFLDAIAAKGSFELLATPQLLVIDGQQADIQVGDRLGFRITTVNETSSLESIEFLEVGTQLEVTPHISTDGLIRMEIHPKVASGEISAEGLPSENTTEANTQMLVRDGQTVMIAGLINTQRTQSRSQVPWLGDLPLIGWLFGINRWSDVRSELIILITPEIIGPEPDAYSRNRESLVAERGELLLEERPVLRDREPFGDRVNRGRIDPPPPGRYRP